MDNHHAYPWWVPPTRPSTALRARGSGGRWTVGLALLVALAGCTSSAAADADLSAALSSTTAPSEAAPGAVKDEARGDSEQTGAPSAEADLLTATPDEHSAVGSLAEGFPTHLLPLPADAVLLVASAVPVGDADVQEVSLNLHTGTSVADLVALYRTSLTDAGFTEATGPDTDLAAALSFTRSGGDELVSIGILDEGERRTVTIGGRLHTDE